MRISALSLDDLPVGAHQEYRAFLMAMQVSAQAPV